MTDTRPNSNACPSPSAFRVAMARALHQLLDEPPVLKDPYALGCLGPETAATLLLDPDAPTAPKIEADQSGHFVRCQHCRARLAMKPVSTRGRTAYRLSVE